MASAASIQNKLLIKIFNKFGSDISVETVASSSKNDYGDATITYNTPSSLVGVPYNQVTGVAWETFGDLQEGEIDFIFKHSETLNINDKITFDSVPYKIIRKEEYPYDNDNLAISVRVAKIL